MNRAIAISVSILLHGAVLGAGVWSTLGRKDAPATFWVSGPIEVSIAFEDEPVPVHIYRDPVEPDTVPPWEFPGNEPPPPEERAPQPSGGPASPPRVETDGEAIEEHNPPPEYPSGARRRGIEGEVVVKVTIRPDGSCSDAVVVESSGSESLDASALQAVLQWRYRPATRGGAPVESTQRVRFVFRLEGRR